MYWKFKPINLELRWDLNCCYENVELRKREGCDRCEKVVAYLNDDDKVNL